VTDLETEVEEEIAETRYISENIYAIISLGIIEIYAILLTLLLSIMVKLVYDL
jgi:hypothetical protein